MIGANPSILGGRKQSSMRILCARETMKSIAGSSHQVLKDQIVLLGLSDHYRVMESAIVGTKNSTEFTFVGLKDANALKSAEGVDVIWIEEANTVSKDSWDKVIPTIRKENSEIWISFNPELETDETYVRFVKNPSPRSKLCFLTYQDNPWLPPDLKLEIEELKATNYEKYEHIYLGKTQESVTGAVYREELKKCELEGRICHVAHDPNRPVDTFWDLGFEDKTAIWFGQLFGGQYRMIDYMQDDGKTIQWYLKEMDKKPYTYRTYYLPWDGTMAYKKLGSGKSTFEILSNLGKKVWLTSMIPVFEGINAVRTVFPQIVFDSEKCRDGIQALRHYQWGPIKSGQRRAEPRHDEYSHGADALRTMAVGAKFPEYSAEDTSAKKVTGRAPALLTGGSQRSWMS